MLKISLPSRMVSELFWECQKSTPGVVKSTPGVVRRRARSVVTVAWHFRLCWDDIFLSVWIMFLQLSRPGPGEGVPCSSSATHRWLTTSSLPQHEAGMWLRPGEPRVPKSVMILFSRELYQTCFFIHWKMLRPSSPPLPRKWVLAASFNASNVVSIA